MSLVEITILFSTISLIKSDLLKSSGSEALQRLNARNNAEKNRISLFLVEDAQNSVALDKVTV